MGSDSNIVRFSFKTFATGREKIFIHIQTILQLASGSRRRMLLSSGGEDTSSQIRHFLEGASTGEPVDAPLVAEGEESAAVSTMAFSYLAFAALLIGHIL